MSRKNRMKSGSGNSAVLTEEYGRNSIQDWESWRRRGKERLGGMVENGK